MRSTMLIAALAALSPTVATAQAEPFKLYDRFNAGPVDPTRWRDGDRVRAIQGGALHLMQRSWGSANGDAGVTAQNWSTSFANPAAVTQMRARVTVNAIEAGACASNPAVADSRARLIGGFFNVGTATPGSQVGDVTAQVRLIRTSDSTDAPGVMRVQGAVFLCTTFDCAGATLVGNIVELGTVTTGTATTVQMQWDQAAKMFHFSRDGTGQSGSVTYPQDDTNPPGVVFRQLSTRVNMPNCESAPPVSGVVDAWFDNVFVNQSAAP